MNSKLHAVCDGLGRPIIMLLTEGQMSDHKGALLLFSALPRAKELLADKGYDSDWFRAALMARGTTPCIEVGWQHCPDRARGARRSSPLRRRSFPRLQVVQQRSGLLAGIGKAESRTIGA